jgi:hypothetical protein
MIEVFSGSEILAQAVNFNLREAGIVTFVRDEYESGRLAGFGTSDAAVSILVDKTDVIEAKLIVEKFLSKTQ